MKLLEFLDTEHIKNRNIQAEKFIEFVLDRLKCDLKPDIKLVDNKKQAEHYKSFGGTDIENGKIWVYIGRRNLADILRTIAHEIVHFVQLKNGDIHGPDDGLTGSDIENQANVIAAALMRVYGRLHPNIFE